MNSFQISIMKVLLSGACFSIGATALAETCENDWSVLSKKEGSFLSLTVREKGTKGPACDLVVRELHYIEGLRVLSLSVSPVTFCPLDAVAEREARLQWQLPFGLRTEGVIRLVVNGEVAGNVLLRSDNVVFDGACR
ncbi:MAG: hypothetical protein KF802_12880 [Bdellovibrionaceae bacterium]|nr:hypothetical protein [Pseudobdellovibrionaceae bacterium]